MKKGRVLDFCIALLPVGVAVLIVGGIQATRSSPRRPDVNANSPIHAKAVSEIYRSYGKGFTLPTTITSSPATQSGSTGIQSATFAIPAGYTITSGQWDVTYSITVPAGTNEAENVRMFPNGTNTNVSLNGLHSGSYSGSRSVAIGSGQLALIQAGAGGNVTADIETSSGFARPISISAWTLTLYFAPIDWGIPTPDGFSSNRRRIVKIIHGR